MNTADTLQTIMQIARKSSELLEPYLAQPVQQETKSTDIDLVTEADENLEDYITTEVLRLFPEGHHLVGEEGGGMGADADDADYFWYIDPIDGTTNFANGIPHFCTSIAVTDADREPLIGVIYDPSRDELYHARRGDGAYLNGREMHVSGTTELINAVVASGFAYDKHQNPDNNIPQWEAFMLRTRGVRRIGSAALDFAYVAAGRLDGYWERSLNPWDALAGVLLVREAGGTVSDYHGGDRPQDDEDGRYVASNGHLHPAMLDVLQESYA